jgi:4-hydroxy-tetrahydrodipicolinate synthase
MKNSCLLSQIVGVYAAVLTPRGKGGALDLPAFEKQLHFLAKHNVEGFAINGATGEYPSTTAEELVALLASARQVVPDHKVLCGVGAVNLAGTLTRGAAAIEAGVQALLLPMPYFFPYDQADLIAYVSQVAEQLSASILLYNLPQFTSGLDPSSVVALMRRHSNIIGVKDSSGSLDTVRLLTEAMPGKTRMIGNDAVLAAALEEQLCDGVVSGIACALPELINGLYSSQMNKVSWLSAKADLEEVIRYLNLLPTPWGLKVVSAERGIVHDEFPLPLSQERSSSIEVLQSWWKQWRPAWGGSRPNSNKTGEAVSQ